MRTRGVLVVLNVLFLVGSASAPPESAPVLGALRSAFRELGADAESLRVRDVAFWEAAAPRLIASGRMLETVPLPGLRDELRPALVDRALRSPRHAVELARDLLLGSLPSTELAQILVPAIWDVHVKGADPIPGDVDVPPLVRELAARLAGLEDLARGALFEGAPDERLPAWLIHGMSAEALPEARVAFDRYGTADLQPLLGYARALVAGLHADSADPETFPRDGLLRIETERGLVLVGTLGQDAFHEDAWLAVDPGGDDLWTNNAGGTAGAFRAALAVDLGGDDAYDARRPFVQGAASHGVGVLVDVAGDDRYAAGTFAQGAAVGGVGLLHDGGGSDRYEAEAFAQGAAAFGWGLLEAGGTGDDLYAVDRMGQGLGRTAGYGCLRDEGGHDHYIARPVHESFYSEWTGGRTIHWSWAQGCGFGFYARYEETLPDGSTGLVIRDILPGGIGLLHDAAGDDVYDGSMYAQGTAYFYALGLCVDLAGDDRYTATWYGQGAAPHFACGILADGAGDDRYEGMHQVQGNGRDFSTAVLLDLDGNDHYVGEDRVQGCGDRRDGYGIFLDARGDDRYVAKRRSARGFATLVKPDEQPTEERPYADWGVFLDLEGTDAYEGPAGGADGTTWRQAATGRGIGIDRGE